MLLIATDPTLGTCRSSKLLEVDSKGLVIPFALFVNFVKVLLVEVQHGTLRHSTHLVKLVVHELLVYLELSIGGLGAVLESANAISSH